MSRPRPPGAGTTGDLFERAAGQPLPRPYSVSELTRALKRAVEPGFRDVWVAGEVANLRRQSSGHVYFSLKDDDAVIGAVLWATQARRLPFALAEGQEVLAHGFVEIYPPHGKYQLIAQEVEPRGAGAQALLLQQVKERLQADGLLDLGPQAAARPSCPAASAWPPAPPPRRSATSSGCSTPASRGSRCWWRRAGCRARAPPPP